MIRRAPAAERRVARSVCWRRLALAVLERAALDAMSTPNETTISPLERCTARQFWETRDYDGWARVAGISADRAAGWRRQAGGTA